MKKNKYIFIGIGLVLVLSLYFLFNPTDFHGYFPECPFYKYSGYYCPGCGSQRAIHDLVHLRILDAIGHNALMIITLFFGTGLYFYSKKKFYQLLYHPKSPYVILGIVILFWILRNLHFSPFHYLSP